MQGTTLQMTTVAWRMPPIDQGLSEFMCEIFGRQFLPYYIDPLGNKHGTCKSPCSIGKSSNQMVGDATPCYQRVGVGMLHKVTKWIQFLSNLRNAIRVTWGEPSIPVPQILASWIHFPQPPPGVMLTPSRHNRWSKRYWWSQVEIQEV